MTPGPAYANSPNQFAVTWKATRRHMMQARSPGRIFSWLKAPELLLAAMLLILAVPALAETIDVSDNHGGSVAQYSAHWSELARRGVNVRIVGPCQSACTVLLGHIPRSRSKLRLPPGAFVLGDRDLGERIFVGHQSLDQCVRRPHA
jgi:hypothetical protein